LQRWGKPPTKKKRERERDTEKGRRDRKQTGGKSLDQTSAPAFEIVEDFIHCPWRIMRHSFHFLSLISPIAHRKAPIDK